MFLYEPEKKLLLASDDGRGFIVEQKDVQAQTRNGKQVLNVSGDVEAKICTEVPDDADHVAVIGQNRKLLIFPMDEMPVMGKGKGVILQRYKDGGVSDVKLFNLEEGLSFKYGAGATTVDDIMPWLGKRAQAGRMPPNGFPKNNKFD